MVSYATHINDFRFEQIDGLTLPKVGDPEHPFAHIKEKGELKILMHYDIDTSRKQTFKSLGNCALGCGISIGVAAIAYTVGIVATLIIASISIPFTVAPPILHLLTLLGGMSTGGLTLAKGYNWYAVPYFKESSLNWKNASILDANCISIELAQANRFPKTKK